MGVKWKTAKNEFPSMEAAVRGLNGRKVKVGVLGGGENAWLAGIHEYGCTIPVTPKMRVYLHAHGLHLKASTRFIVIPERSFLRSGFDENHEKVLAQAEKLLASALEGKISPDALCIEIGTTLSTKIKRYAEQLHTPANHPYTVEQKGSANPLVDTGDMIDAITFEVE